MDLIKDKNFSLCFIMVEEKDILHKANGDHVTNTHVASNEKISSLSALSFAIDESERKEKSYLNPAFKRVNHLAIY